MSVTKLFRDLASGLNNGSYPLIWLPQYEMGYCPPSPSAPQLYNESYFQEYKKRAATPMGEALTHERCQIVQSFYKQSIVDIGIGSGQFLTFHHRARGYDVNPFAIEILKSRDQWCDPYEASVAAVTCWDSLEHISDPELLLANVNRWVFVSLPIFRNAEHALTSKHFKPDEHLWYWTEMGFVRWMKACGFSYMHSNKMETKLGREDIETFVFKRV